MIPLGVLAGRRASGGPVFVSRVTNNEPGSSPVMVSGGAVVTLASQNRSEPVSCTVSGAAATRLLYVHTTSGSAGVQSAVSMWWLPDPPPAPVVVDFEFEAIAPANQMWQVTFIDGLPAAPVVDIAVHAGTSGGVVPDLDCAGSIWVGVAVARSNNGITPRYAGVDHNYSTSGNLRESEVTVAMASPIGWVESLSSGAAGLVGLR